MADSVKEGVAAERLRLAKVGDGYIELNTPRRFVSVFKLAGGVNPYNDDDQAIQGKVAQFDNAIRQLRANEEIQVLLRRVPVQGEKLAADFRESCSENAPEGYRNHFNARQEEWIEDFAANNSLCGFETYLLFTINQDTKPVSESMFDFFTGLISSSKPKPSDPLQNLDEVQRRAKTWCTSLTVAGLGIEELSKGDIYRLLYSEINLMPWLGSVAGFERTESVSAGPDGFQTLREALATQPIEVEPRHVKVGETYVRTMSVMNFPIFGEKPLFLYQFLEQVENFKISLFVRGVDQDLGKSIIKKQLNQDSSSFSPDGRKKNYDSEASGIKRDATLAEIAQGDTGLAKSALFVSVYGSSESDLKDKYENFASRLPDIHKYDGVFQQEQLFFSTLPLCFNEVQQKHEWMRTTADISNCWPFFMDPMADDSGVILGYSETNQVVKIDLYTSRNENNNIAIFGSSGSGKSVGAQVILNRLMPQGPFGTIIDRSGTYATTCDAAGGEYIKYDLQCKKHANPFDCPEESYRIKGVVSEDQEEAAMGFVSTVLSEITEEGKERPMTQVETSLIFTAIKRTYLRIFKETKGEKYPLLRDVRRTFLEMSKSGEVSEKSRETCMTFAEILLQYVEDGPYANICDRETNIDPQNPLLVFDTALMAKRPKLKALVTYLITSFAFARARYCHDQGRRAFTLCDELWDLISTHSGRQLADILSRTSRHLGNAFIPITQRISDVTGNEEARTILDNAGTKIFLKLGDQDRALCAQAFELNEKDSRQVSSLHMLRNVYSKAYIKTAYRQGAVYIVADPLTRWISTSFPADRDLRKEYMASFNPEGTVEGCWYALYKLVEHEIEPI